MANDWSENVADFGLGSLGVGLCARLRFFPNLIITNQPDILPSGFAMIGEYTPIGDPEPVWAQSSLPKHAPHFPYGWDVL